MVHYHDVHFPPHAEGVGTRAGYYRWVDTLGCMASNMGQDPH